MFELGYKRVLRTEMVRNSCAWLQNIESNISGRGLSVPSLVILVSAVHNIMQTEQTKQQ